MTSQKKPKKNKITGIAIATKTCIKLYNLSDLIDKYHYDLDEKEREMRKKNRFNAYSNDNNKTDDLKNENNNENTTLYEQMIKDLSDANKDENEKMDEQELQDLTKNIMADIKHTVVRYRQLDIDPSQLPGFFFVFFNLLFFCLTLNFLNGIETREFAIV